LWITGHSSGGALASLAALTFVDTHEKTVGTNCLAGVITFGQPIMADQVFANEFNSKLKGRAYRYYNNLDIVPTMPICLLPYSREYCHVGEGVLLNCPKWIRRNQLKNRLMLAPLLFEGVRAHFPSEYKEALDRLL